MNTATLEHLYRTPGVGRVDALNKGLRASVFLKLAATLGMSAPALAGTLGLSERTMRERTRKTSNMLTADEAERSFRAFRVFKRAIEVLGTEETARAWLVTPQRGLSERRPVDLLARDVGAEEVLNLLGAIHEGVYL